MKNLYNKINSRLIWIFLCIACIQYSAAQLEIQIPSKREVLNTLKGEHPRLISAESIGKIKMLIQEDELAQQIWKSNLKFAQGLLNKKPLVYNKPDGRRLLSVSREALERIRSLSLIYLILGEKKYAERAWQELSAVASFSDWNPSHFLDCTEMTHAVALGYDWLYNFWSAEQKKNASASDFTKRFESCSRSL